MAGPTPVGTTVPQNHVAWFSGHSAQCNDYIAKKGTSHLKYPSLP